MVLPKKKSSRGRPPKAKQNPATPIGKTTKEREDTQDTEHQSDSGYNLVDILKTLQAENHVDSRTKTPTKDSEPSVKGYTGYDTDIGDSGFCASGSGSGSSGFGALPRMDDPLVHLHRQNVSATPLEIVDYVNLGLPPVTITPNPEGSISDLIESIVQIKAGPRRPKLEDVSIADWCIANTRIMDKLFGSHPNIAVRDYWAYTVKICELFRDYDRVSVLLYDQEYRHMQAASGFRWGCDIPHLQTTRLVRKNAQHHYQQNAQRQSYAPKKDGICKQYNTKAGCKYGSRCKFNHHCQECKKDDHPRFSCTNASSAAATADDGSNQQQ